MNISPHFFLSNFYPKKRFDNPTPNFLLIPPDEFNRNLNLQRQHHSYLDCSKDMERVRLASLHSKINVFNQMFNMEKQVKKIRHRELYGKEIKQLMENINNDNIHLLRPFLKYHAQYEKKNNLDTKQTILGMVDNALFHVNKTNANKADIILEFGEKHNINLKDLSYLFEAINENNNSLVTPLLLNDFAVLKKRQNNLKFKTFTEIISFLDKDNYHLYKQLLKNYEDGRYLSADEIKVLIGIKKSNEYKNIENVSELDYEKQKTFLNNIINLNGSLMIGESSYLKKHYPIISTTSKRYCKIVNELATSIISYENSMLRSTPALKEQIEIIKTKRQKTDNELSDYEKSLVALVIMGKGNLNKENYIGQIKNTKYFPENLIQDTKVILDNLDWKEKLVKSRDQDAYAKIIAFNLRKKGLFDIINHILKDDPKSNSHKNEEKYIEKIDNYINLLQSSRLILPRTKIPKATYIDNSFEQTSEGISNKVVYIEKDTDLKKAGFNDDVNIDNFFGIVHTIDANCFNKLDYEAKLLNIFTMKNMDKDLILSASYIDKDNFHTFREYGIFCDVENENLLGGYFRDFASEFVKNPQNVLNNYLFGTKQTFVDYYNKDLKSALNFNSEQYENFCNKIVDCKSINDFKEKLDESTFQKYFLFLKSMERKSSLGRNDERYNELFVNKVSPCAIFVRNKQLNEIPIEFRKFAQTHDIPILIFYTNNLIKF